MYDVIVIGARCSGSPTARLLALRGYRVLMVDKATFPSDAISTHYLHFPAVARLQRWGLLDTVLATGCPPIDRMTWGMNDVYITGTAPEWDGVRFGLAPRRHVLDKILFDAAVDAGVEAREGFTVDEVLVEGGRVVGIRGHDQRRATMEARAPLVIGADGIRSLVAETVNATEYQGMPPQTAVWYSYWQRTDIDHLIFTRVDGRELFLVPTNDDCVNVMVGWRHHEFQDFRRDIEGNYQRTLDLFPELAERVRAGRQVETFYGTRNTRQWMRHPHGPGYLLIGDAGYHKDPVAGIGISDAFRQAEEVADCVDEGLSGRRPMSEALADYHQWRDAAFGEVFEYYMRAAALDILPPEVLDVMDALRFDEEECTNFFGIVGGFHSFKAFFAPENCARILAKTKAARAAAGTERPRPAAPVAAAGAGSGSAWSNWLPSDQAM